MNHKYQTHVLESLAELSTYIKIQLKKQKIVKGKINWNIIQGQEPTMNVIYSFPPWKFEQDIGGYDTKTEILNLGFGDALENLKYALGGSIDVTNSGNQITISKN